MGGKIISDFVEPHASWSAGNLLRYSWERLFYWEGLCLLASNCKKLLQISQGCCTDAPCRFPSLVLELDVFLFVSGHSPVNLNVMKEGTVSPLLVLAENPFRRQRFILRYHFEDSPLFHMSAP